MKFENQSPARSLFLLCGLLSFGICHAAKTDSKPYDASFKLHAPKNTTVEGRVENGKLTDLKVTPESRRKDVILGANHVGQASRLH